MRGDQDGWLIKVRAVPEGTALRVVAPREPLDGPNTQALLSLLAPLLSAGGPCRLTLVLGNVAHVSGLALRVLARLHEQLRAGGGRLTLRAAPGPVYEEVEALGLTRTLDARGRGRGGHGAAAHALSAPSPAKRPARPDSGRDAGASGGFCTGQPVRLRADAQGLSAGCAGRVLRADRLPAAGGEAVLYFCEMDGPGGARLAAFYPDEIESFG
jgi:anti-anti-sigma regulatory factor